LEPAPIIAHAGHVLVDLLTLVPVVALAGFFLVVAWRDRRRRRAGTSADG
jgi:hypothetical protein